MLVQNLLQLGRLTLNVGAVVVEEVPLAMKPVDNSTCETMLLLVTDSIFQHTKAALATLATDVRGSQTTSVKIVIPVAHVNMALRRVAEGEVVVVVVDVEVVVMVVVVEVIVLFAHIVSGLVILMTDVFSVLDILMEVGLSLQVLFMLVQTVFMVEVEAIHLLKDILVEEEVMLLTPFMLDLHMVTTLMILPGIWIVALTIM